VVLEKEKESERESVRERENEGLVEKGRIGRNGRSTHSSELHSLGSLVSVGHDDGTSVVLVVSHSYPSDGVGVVVVIPEFSVGVPLDLQESEVAGQRNLRRREESKIEEEEKRIRVTHLPGSNEVV